MTDRPDDAEIAAFVAGELDGPRRFAVAGQLAADPERAAEAMADFHLAEGLRLAMPDLPPAPSGVTAAADRLADALKRRQWFRKLRLLAASGVLFAFGMTTQSLLFGRVDDQKELIDAALAAQDAVQLRLTMASQPESQILDVAEISRKLGVTVPRLPEGWILRDVQVMSSPDQPGLVMVLDTPDIGQVLLFAVPQPLVRHSLPPEASIEEGVSVATFEQGRTAYVLVDNAGPASDMAKGALKLQSRLN